MIDAERLQEGGQLDGGVGGDLVDEVLGAAPAEAVEPLEVLDLQRVEVDDARQQARVDGLGHDFGSEALDVDDLGEVLQLAEAGGHALIGLGAEQELAVALLAADSALLLHAGQCVGTANFFAPGPGARSVRST